MINILISAYAVSPTWGSEPGMGWNWIINIAKHCNVFVITEGEWRKEIGDAVEKLPQKDNLHFYYNPVSNKVRRMCWNQGDWRFYWFYKQWQKKTLKIAKDIIARNHIDVMHQLNMIGFREPGYLWKIKDIPLVWGPVGGMGSSDSVPNSYLKTMGFKQRLVVAIKKLITNAQIKYHPRVRQMVKHAYIIGAVPSVCQKLKKYHQIDVQIIPETGTHIDNFNGTTTHNDTFDVLWAGRLIPTKRLDIALMAIAKTKNPKIRIKICGVGSEAEVNYYQDMINQLNIKDKVIWLGKVPHEKMSQQMAQSELFFMTSIADATSTVVVEAISEGLPILSFNACGFGAIVKQFAGITIELSNPDDSVLEFARKIDFLSNHPEVLQQIRERQIDNRYVLSWEYKGEELSRIYNGLIFDKQVAKTGLTDEALEIKHKPSQM